MHGNSLSELWKFPSNYKFLTSPIYPLENSSILFSAHLLTKWKPQDSARGSRCMKLRETVCWKASVVLVKCHKLSFSVLLCLQYDLLMKLLLVYSRVNLFSTLCDVMSCTIDIHKKYTFNELSMIVISFEIGNRFFAINNLLFHFSFIPNKDPSDF